MKGTQKCISTRVMGCCGALELGLDQCPVSRGVVVHASTHVSPVSPVPMLRAAHLALIPIDGCSINPARTFATSWTNNNWDDHW